VTLIDTSAWIEFLRDTGSSTCRRVHELLDDDVAITDAIRMEVLAGARDDAHLAQLRGLLARGRSCRRNRDTSRRRPLSTEPVVVRVRRCAG
jgi:predicted nucleic acid-binding protein